MNKQTVLWTTLPYAVRKEGKGEVLVLSVFLSPQLWCDESARFLTLGAFPDFLDLPQKIKAASFTVEFDGGPSLPATPAPLDPGQKPAKPDSTLWKALFNADTIVLPYSFPDYTSRTLDSYSALALLDYMRALYQRVGSEIDLGAGANYPKTGALATVDALRAIESPEHKQARQDKANQEASEAKTRQAELVAMNTARDLAFSDWKKNRGAPTVDDLSSLEKERAVRWPPRPLRKGGYPFYAEVPARDPFLEVKGEAAANPEPRAAIDEPPPTLEMEEWAGVFAAFRRFHQPHFANVLPSSQSDLVEKLKDETIKDAELEEVFDFHRALAALASYPRLLRLLGLVVDLTVPWDLKIFDSSLARVVAKWPSSLPTINYSLRTAYSLAGSRFQASPMTNTLSNGFLHLGNSGCVVAQVDVDGAAFKLSNLAGDLQDSLTTPEAAEPSSLPALRSGGVALLRRDPISLLQEKFGAAKNMAAVTEELKKELKPENQTVQNKPSLDGSDVVFAEMLVRGYRVDVFDDHGKKWRSLHRRVGTYDFVKPDVATQTIADEGFSQLSATRAPDGSKPDLDLHVHEALAVWEGWSLAAPKPGKAIANPEAIAYQGDETPLQASNKNPSATEFGLQVTFTPEPGSLPRLRFGYNYRLRVRVADLAGNSVSSGVNDTNPSLAEATEMTMYQRFEPVSSPFLVPLREFGDGESLERMVIRSRPSSPVESCGRHVVPPKSAQFLAEMHAKFDDGPKLKRTKDGYDLAKREKETLKGDPETFKISPQETINPLPYLPDPFARGAVLLGLPTLAPSIVIADTNKIAFAGEFPGVDSFRLMLQDGNSAPNWDKKEATLKVFLPPGEIARVRLSSFVTADDLKQMGVWQWITEKDPSNLNDLRQRAQDGCHWMITPYRTLMLIHAVAQPLSSPRFDSLGGDRANAGESSAMISGFLAVDRKSTAQVDVFAEWADPLDDPADPQNDPTKDLLKHSSPVGAGVHIPFGSTGLETGLGVITASLKPEIFELRHDLGDTKYHQVKYRATATTRFRDYFVHEVKEGLQITRDMEPENWKYLDISSSARPAAPRVVYVVPTFRWESRPRRATLEEEPLERRRATFGEEFLERSPATFAEELLERRPEDDGKLVRTRHGGGLRVYLERPWFSSGDGELLGVVFQQKPFEEVSALAQARVTQWGMDPLWSAEAPGSTPGYENFKDFIYPAQPGLGDTFTLDEMSEPVSVAAYPVEYDEQRRLWFADIEIATGAAYFPFVRLALARCQPHSLAGVELSRVVLADFAQLTPDRTLTVKPLRTNRRETKLHITLNGVSYFDWRQPADIEIRLQDRFADVPGDLGWLDVPISDFQIEPDAERIGLWSGQVSYREEVRGKPHPARRLMILESEHLSRSSQRVIYADLVDLPLKQTPSRIVRLRDV